MDAPLGLADEVRPDTYYGVSKLFGEQVGRLYADRYGLEVVCLRICTCSPEPTDHISLGTWLSPGEQALFARMGRHDRAHALRVARHLLSAGTDDRDLIVAGLLHDVAKAGTPTTPGRVRLVDRVAPASAPRPRVAPAPLPAPAG